MTDKKVAYILADVCKNCGGNITFRTKAQGWIHSDYERRCPPRYAEPSSNVRTV